MKRGQEFADITYELLIQGEYDLRRTAACMGMGYDSLHARVHNRTCFSADEIRDLIACVPDHRLVGYLLRGTAYVAAERTADSTIGAAEAEVMPTAHRVVYEAIDVMKAIETALRDDLIDHREAVQIRNEIEVAERVLVTLREHVAALN